MSAATDSKVPPVQFFAYSNGNGFAKFEPLNDRSGYLWVMGKRETEWVLAGCESRVWLNEVLQSGMMYEFSPARLLGRTPAKVRVSTTEAAQVLGAVSSAAKADAARANGAKGGRPRNPDSKRARRV